MARPNQAKIDLHALLHNLGVARSCAPRSRVMAVVKANAYGHGAVAVARALEKAVDALAVASIEEAFTLREAGVACPVLLLEGIFDAGELLACATQGFWVVVENERQLDWLERSQLPRPVESCWLKVDTGMHRLGVAPSQAAEFHRRLLDCKNVSDHVVTCTHFASADLLDSVQTPQQIELFNQVTADLPGPRSAANSPGVLAWPAAHYDWIRPGYMLYGDSPFEAPQPNADRLLPVMTLCSEVISVRDVPAGETVGYGATWRAERDSRIATVTAGYGDGYPRTAVNGTPVLIAGQRASLAGRVSMDMITVDVTDLEDVDIGDEAILWGEELPVGEVARCAGTIGYELLTRMPPRTPRVVVRG
ncbi:alanine racemase [Mangrovimicrobium sediminis]|uniref:Alanine racemase n=1 Tax=Mangrovimicrobium sediminis TaxID=2562682 RepID=A0A4Z0LX93_9GAMM|nr:alanine racemase [Haliea sp. SAOS-164]TGD71899.1 alanine racemase [Haliea sp. SAOS-164]